MILGIDARSLVAPAPPTGVGTYTRSMIYALLNSLQTYRPGASIKLFTTGRTNLTPKNLISTILHTVFDVGQLRLMPSFGAVSRLAENPPIPGLGLG